MREKKTTGIKRAKCYDYLMKSSVVKCILSIILF